MSIGTTTSAFGTDAGMNVSVTFASNGTALVSWYDGTNIKVSYASSPYTSWTALTVSAASGMLVGSRLDVSDTVNLAFYISSGLDYAPVTLSGTTYTVGSLDQIASQATGGNALMGCILEKDPQGRYWAVVTNRAGSSIIAYETTTPATAGWTNNHSVSWSSGTLNNWPAGGIVGNYLLFVYPSASSTFDYQRLDVSGASLGSWSSATVLTLGGSSPTNNNYASFRGNSTVGVLANDSGSGIWARVYTPGTDSWASAVQLSSGASDAKPTVIAGGDGNLYVFWQSFVGSNNFAIVYKKYNVSGATWDSSPTTVVASGANNFNVSGGSSSSMIGLVYQTGTASPYTINFATVTLATVTDKDTTYRGKVSATAAKNTTFRAPISKAVSHDTVYRANVGHPASHDTTFRGVISKAIGHDTVFRGKVGHLASHDLAYRAPISQAARHDTVFRGKVVGSGPSSGAAALFASGSGTASFDSFRVAVYPDPAISLAAVGRATSSLVNWNANEPASTGLTVETSLDNGTTWSSVAASGDAIPGIALQPDAVIDAFTVDSSASYTQSNFGGTTGAWTWDTANGRLTGAGGNTGTLVNSTALTGGDSLVAGDFDQADGSGLIASYQDASNLYYVQAWDASGTGTQNAVKLFKRAGGVSTQLGSTATIATWTRGRFRRFILDVQAGVLTVSMDGVQLIQQTDGSPLAAGKSGLLLGTLLRCIGLRIQQYGQDVRDLTVCTRLTLTSSDPTTTPQALDMQTFVASEDIDPGALIPTADYRRTYVSDNANDLNTKSATTWWYVRPDKSTVFRQRTATPAPWILDSGNKGPLYTTGKQQGDLLVGNFQLSASGDLYRNRQILTNVQATGTFTESRQGDGSTRTWNLSNALAAAPTILLNGQQVTVGVKNVDTGKQFYYLLGSKTIDQDSSQTVLQKSDVLSFPDYTGSFVTEVVRDNATAGTFVGTTSQEELAAIDKTSGIVENVLDVSKLNLDVAAAEAYGDQLLAQFGVLNARTLSFQTFRDGLQPGQDLLAYVPEQQVIGGHFLIVQVGESASIAAVPGGVLYRYSVVATEGPALGSTWKLLSSLFKS